MTYVEPSADGRTVEPTKPLPPAAAKRAAHDEVWAEIVGQDQPPKYRNRAQRRRVERIIRRAVDKGKRQIRGQQ